MKEETFRFIEIIRKQGINEAVRSASRYVQNRVLKSAIGSLYRPYFEYRYGEGVTVMEEDWDNLILLDACRWDIFRDHTSFEGEPNRAVSKGNYSWEFMEENFVGRSFSDTVYVTANPFAEKLPQDTFYTIESVLSEWSDQHETVLPKDVTERALRANKKHPDKCLIIHYMQPHAPHLGDFVSTLDTAVGGWGESHEQLNNEEYKQTIWQLFRNGVITKSQLRRSYIENLKIVEQEVIQMIRELDGKTVISSDHGENLGETFLGMKYLSHANETKNCRFVPWLELPYDERRSVTEEEPVGYEKLEEKKLRGKLEDLGYL